MARAADYSMPFQVYRICGIAKEWPNGNAAAMSESSNQKDSAGTARHPRAVSLVLCDRIITDARSGRRTFVDLVDAMSLSTLRSPVVLVSVYPRLTDLQGGYRMKVDVVWRDDLVNVGDTDVEDFTTIDPLEDVEIIVHQLRAALESTGCYDVRMWANGRFVQSVSLRVLE